jgi:hypothetical protein
MNDFNCKAVRGSLWDYASGMLDDTARHGIEQHLNRCRECVLHNGEVRSLRTGLRHLPSVNVPGILQTRLRVLASRERARRAVRRDFASWLADQKVRARLFFDNLLRPFAVPAAGGILASCLCFGIVADNLRIPMDWENDLPIGISTEVAIDELSPFSCGGRDVEVNLSVDSQGHVTDYELLNVAHASREELQEVGNLVLYSTFSPAVRMGRRVASKRIFLIGHISIKG